MRDADGLGVVADDVGRNGRLVRRYLIRFAGGRPRVAISRRKG